MHRIKKHAKRCVAMLVFIFIYFCLLFSVVILNEWKVIGRAKIEHISNGDDYGKFALQFLFF